MNNQKMNQNMNNSSDSDKGSPSPQEATPFITYTCLYRSIHNPTAADEDCCVPMRSANLPPLGSLSFIDKYKLMVDASDRLDIMHEDGVKFFTKEAFVDIIRQFDEKKDKVQVKALNGETVDVKLLGMEEVLPWEYGDERYKCFIAQPCLYYHSPVRLMTAAAGFLTFRPIRLWSSQETLLFDHFCPARAYLPLEVIHWTQKRCSLTFHETAVFPTAPLPECRDNLRAAQTAFRDSAYFAALAAALKDVFGVKNIVAFACGSLSWARNEKPAHHAQHALVRALGEMCKVGEGKVYVQDPIYTPADKEMLKEEGMTILDDPRAFVEVSDESVVVAAYPDIPVREIVTDLARPKVLLWNRVHEIGEDNIVDELTKSDPVSPRVANMIRDEYTEIDMPEQEHFAGLALYIRK